MAAIGDKEPMKVTWQELGSPTAPCTRLVRGAHIEIRASDIKTSQGRPDAIFTAIPFESLSRPKIWLLGTVEFPDQEGE